MKLKYEEVEIDNIKFGTTQFPAMRSLELMGKLVQTIGPALGVISTADPNTPLEQLAPVLAGALSNLKPAELGTLALEILAGTSATVETDGKFRRLDIMSKKDFDEVFSGRLMTMFKAVLHALQVNYADFGFGSGPAQDAPNPAENQ